MVSKIKAWLNGGRDFCTGVSIYTLYGDDDDFKNRLSRGETSLLKSELFHALKALLSERPAEPSAVLIEPTSNAIAAAAKQAADVLYKQMQNKRAEMLALCPLTQDPLENEADMQQKRGLLAQDVLRLQEQVDKVYKDYRYAQIHGQLPDSPAAAPVDPVLLHERITNLRKNISKLKKNPAKAAILAEKQILLSDLIKQYEDARKS